MWWLNPRNARIKVYKNRASFWTINNKGKFKLIRTIKFSSTGKWDISPKKAITLPICYALALRMKILKLPKKWNRMESYKPWKAGKMCLERYEDKYRLKFRSIYGQTVSVPLDFFTPDLLDYINDKYREKLIDKNFDLTIHINKRLRENKKLSRPS